MAGVSEQHKPTEAQENQDFDVAAELAAFLADSTRSELQLPHMTTGQRKKARKLVEEHDQLRCESYGFGAERQLHIFKGAASTAKDSCISPTSVGALEAPADMCKPVEADSVSSTVAAPTGCTSPQESGSSPASTERAFSDEAGKRYIHIEGIGPVDEQVVKSMSRSQEKDKELPGLPQAEGFTVRVRGTFIHVEPAAHDPRVVQSMPHGMFSQCLAEESAKAAAAAAEPAATPAEAVPTPPPSAPPAAAPVSCFAPGAEVVVEGLTKCPAFNGLPGVVQSLDEETGRYNVLLQARNGGAPQWAKIKGENLRLSIPPPPPCYPQGLVLENIVPQTVGLPSLPPSPLWEDRVSMSSPLVLTALV